MSKNDVTGDNILSKVATEAYRNNFDAIFRKPNKTVVQSKNTGENHEPKEICESTILGVLHPE